MVLRKRRAASQPLFGGRRRTRADARAHVREGARAKRGTRMGQRERRVRRGTQQTAGISHVFVPSGAVPKFRELDAGSEKEFSLDRKRKGDSFRTHYLRHFRWIHIDQRSRAHGQKSRRGVHHADNPSRQMLRTAAKLIHVHQPSPTAKRFQVCK